MGVTHVRLPLSRNSFDEDMQSQYTAGLSCLYLCPTRFSATVRLSCHNGCVPRASFPEDRARSIEERRAGCHSFFTKPSQAPNGFGSFNSRPMIARKKKSKNIRIHTRLRIASQGSNEAIPVVGGWLTVRMKRRKGAEMILFLFILLLFLWADHQ